MTKDKRLEIRLPSDHWIWRYPPGSRSKRMREALGIMETLQETLINLDRCLEQVEEILSAGELFIASGKGNPEQPDGRNIKFDTEAFMDI